MAADKPRVLLVDDNEATCTLVAALLQREFSIQIATDGVEALEKIRTNRYAAILLDLRMPILDGFAVLSQVNEQQPEVLKRIVIMTAAVSQKELERVQQYPICSVVRKPFEVETLLNAVKSCVEAAGPGLHGMFSSGVILLIAEMLQRRWL
jgi:CheY-like chemotaxis protein